MESKIKDSYDALLVMQAPGSVALTADGTSALVDINLIPNGRGDIAGRYGESSFIVDYHIVALDHTTGDETYTLNFNSYDKNGANPVTHAQVVFTTADVGKSGTIGFDTSSIGTKDPDGAKFGIFVDVGGTTPSFQYWAFIAPSRCF